MPRVVLVALTLLLLTIQSLAALPEGPAPAPLPIPHVPDPLHAFVWRNWDVVPTARIAKVVGASEDQVRDLAESMGLAPEHAISRDREARQYLTVIRRNWHLLPYDQLLTLLDWPQERLETTLREDDFLWIKLGSLKPRCTPIRYAPPTPEARRREAQIKAIIQQEFGDELKRDAEPPFAFLKRFRAPVEHPATLHTTTPNAPPAFRMAYSYFAVYGDPLLDPTLDPYPDELLRELSGQGVNAVWLHIVLRQMAPSDQFPEFGQGHEQRLASLRKLVDRAARFGIGIYLYLNEPRAMPAEFFKARPQLAGVHEADYVAMCTSMPEVRRWMSNSLTYVFANTPGLAGVFTITASENLTNCASHGQLHSCPHCKSRGGDEIIAEVNSTIVEGVHRGNAKANVIVWDWGWPEDWTPSIILRLPRASSFMSVSEWGMPLRRGGVASTVGEYSISAVGPGARAKEHWRLARDAGLSTIAKVQLNNSWELSAVPWITVPDLVARHCEGLRAANVNGLMLSWTLGGYPSPNLRIARRMLDENPAPTRDQILDDLARERYGPDGVAPARRAWAHFSQAFEQYPFDAGVIYTCPVQYGPANLLYAKPTGYRATMVGFPYDDLNSWRGPYPAETFQHQFDQIATQWQSGLEELAKALPTNRPETRTDMAMARAAQLHFRAVAAQARFVITRNALAAPNLAPERRRELLTSIRATLEGEIDSAKSLFALARQDSRIGFEASNHYYYLPQDLEEKVLNCRDLLDQFPLVDAAAPGPRPGQSDK